MQTPIFCPRPPLNQKIPRYLLRGGNSLFPNSGGCECPVVLDGVKTTPEALWETIWRGQGIVSMKL